MSNLILNEVEYKDYCDDILWNEDVFEHITPETIVGQGRWETTYCQVVKHIESGKLFEICWRRGSTEMQDSSNEYWWQEVEPKVVSKTVYVPIGTGS